MDDSGVPPFQETSMRIQYIEVSMGYAMVPQIIQSVGHFRHFGIESHGDLGIPHASKEEILQDMFGTIRSSYRSAQCKIPQPESSMVGDIGGI